MKVLTKDNMQDGTLIQIEEWNENYSFMPYGRTLATYPISKGNHRGSFSPKLDQKFRCEFEFDSHEEAKSAFNELLTGNKTLLDYADFLRDRKYQDCI